MCVYGASNQAISRVKCTLPKPKMVLTNKQQYHIWAVRRRRKTRRWVEMYPPHSIVAPPHLHCVPYNTFGGKFMSGSLNSGGSFFPPRGAFFCQGGPFLCQGGTFLALKKEQLNAPLNKKCTVKNLAHFETKGVFIRKWKIPILLFFGHWNYYIDIYKIADGRLHCQTWTQRPQSSQ